MLDGISGTFKERQKWFFIRQQAILRFMKKFKICTYRFRIEDSKFIFDMEGMRDPSSSANT